MGAHRIVSIVVGLCGLLEAAGLAAELPRFSTNFKFEVRFVDVVHSYNENQSLDVNVWLPPDTGWECRRLSATQFCIVTAFAAPSERRSAF